MIYDNIDTPTEQFEKPILEKLNNNETRYSLTFTEKGGFLREERRVNDESGWTHYVTEYYVNKENIHQINDSLKKNKYSIIDCFCARKHFEISYDNTHHTPDQYSSIDVVFGRIKGQAKLTNHKLSLEVTLTDKTIQHVFTDFDNKRINETIERLL